MAPFEWKNKKINLLDTPGLFDFQGGLYEAARAQNPVVIVLAGKSGVSVGTEKAFAAAEKRGLSKIFFVNGLCDEGSDFYKVFEDLKASFGPSVCPIVVPYFEDGKADKYINMLEYKAYDYSGGKPVQVDMPNMAPVLRVCVPPFTRPSPKRATSCSRNISPAKNSRRKRLSSVFPRVLKAAPFRPCSAATLCLCAAWSSLWTAFAGSPRARRIRARKSA